MMEDNESLTDVAKVFMAMPSRFRGGQFDRLTTYCFSIGEERWTVLIDVDQCQVLQGRTVEEPDCFLETSPEIFLGTLRGTYTPGIVDLVSGKVKTNNPFLLQNFRDSFVE